MTNKLTEKNAWYRANNIEDTRVKKIFKNKKIAKKDISDVSM